MSDENRRAGSERHKAWLRRKTPETTGLQHAAKKEEKMKRAPDGRGGLAFVGPDAEKIGAILLGRQEPGAILNGSRVVKTGSEPGDRTPDRTPGTVLGSMGGPGPIVIEGRSVTYGYLIRWDNCPGEAVFTTDIKVARL